MTFRLLIGPSRVSGLAVASESGYRVLYTYAGQGRLVQMLYPQVPGLSLNYQLTDPATEPPGDGGDPYVGYDRFGRTEDLRWVLGSDNPLRLLYGYDRDSRRTWRKDVSTGGDIGTRQEDLAWKYDGLSQVTDARRGALNINRTAIGGIPAQSEAFGYDETGNWLSYGMETDGVSTLEQTRKNDRDNRMVQINGSSSGITYDNAGNLTQGLLNDSGSYNKLTWDAWGRLVEVSTATDELVMSFGYDALYRRITKAAGGVTRHSYYSDGWKALEQYDDPGTGTPVLARRWFWGARTGHRDELVFRDRDTDGNGTLDERLYCLMDYFSPAAIVNLSGSVLERYAFTAFGKRRIMTADYAARTDSLYDWEFGLQGQFLDLETWNGSGEQTGLYNYGYRYYVPALGRWPSRDPIGENGGLNLYEITDDDPVNKVDLFGLQNQGAGAPPPAEGRKVPGSFPNTMNCAGFAFCNTDKWYQPPKGKTPRQMMGVAGCSQSSAAASCNKGEKKVYLAEWQDMNDQSDQMHLATETDQNRDGNNNWWAHKVGGDQPQYSRSGLTGTMGAYGPLGKEPSVQNADHLRESYWCCKCPMSDATKQALKNQGYEGNPIKNK